jgi:hypothetical protein
MAYYYSLIRFVSGSWLAYISSDFCLSYYFGGGFVCVAYGYCSIFFY